MKKNTMKRTTYNKIWAKIAESRKQYHYRGAYYDTMDGKLWKITDEDVLLLNKGLTPTAKWQLIEVID